MAPRKERSLLPRVLPLRFLINSGPGSGGWGSWPRIIRLFRTARDECKSTIVLFSFIPAVYTLKNRALGALKESPLFCFSAVTVA